MRLINANNIEFRKKFCRRFCTNLSDVESCKRSDTCDVMKWIDEQPTAYDVDKAVEDLKVSDFYIDQEKCITVEDAISIVKGAVKNEQ